MAFTANVKTMSAVGITTGTAAQLTASTKVIPNGVWALETDTGYMKLGDGAKKYSELPYKIQSVLLPAQRTMLDNAGAANGVAKLDASGKLTMSQLPDEIITNALTGNIVYVADIAARDALTGTDKTGLVIVMDASADSTVTSGSAAYTFRSQEQGGSASGDWIKVLEFESMDLDFDTILANHFKYQGANANTLDDIQDGTTYIKMSAAWKSSVDTDIANLKSRMTTAEGDIDALEGRMDTAESDIDALETAVKELTDGTSLVYLEPVAISELEAAIA